MSIPVSGSIDCRVRTPFCSETLENLKFLSSLNSIHCLIFFSPYSISLLTGFAFSSLFAFGSFSSDFDTVFFYFSPCAPWTFFGSFSVGIGFHSLVFGSFLLSLIVIFTEGLSGNFRLYGVFLGLIPYFSSIACSSGLSVIKLRLSVCFPSGVFPNDQKSFSKKPLIFSLSPFGSNDPMSSIAFWMLTVFPSCTDFTISVIFFVAFVVPTIVFGEVRSLE